LEPVALLGEIAMAMAKPIQQAQIVMRVALLVMLARLIIQAVQMVRIRIVMGKSMRDLRPPQKIVLVLVMDSDLCLLVLARVIVPA
jgi:hypothetical protein